MVDFNLISEMLSPIGKIILALIFVLIIFAIFIPPSRNFLTHIGTWLYSHIEFLPVILGAIFLCIAISIFNEDQATAAFSAGLGLILVGVGGTASIRNLLVGVITGSPGLILVVVSFYI